MSSPDPIELFSTEELSDELSKRFDAVIICGIKHPKKDKDIIYRAWSGNAYSCLGLAEFLKNEIFKKDNNDLFEMRDNQDR